MANCFPPNSVSMSSSGGNWDSSLTCGCKSGYISTSGGIELNDNSDFCTPCSLYSDVNISSQRMAISLLHEIDSNEISMLHRGSDNALTDVPIDETNISNEKEFAINGLISGNYYKGTFSFENTAFVSIECPFVTSCSCSDDDEEKTGRPKSLVISQNLGHVTFTFNDSSRCRDSYSFTRFNGSHEFLSGIDEIGVSFTSDYRFIPPGQNCGTEVNPGTDASDDLTISKLTVGKIYTYCVRAVKVSLSVFVSL